MEASSKRMMTRPPIKPILSVVIPCYNEEAILPFTLTALLASLQDMVHSDLIAPQSFLCFVNDGSTDGTWEIIQRAHTEFPTLVQALNLSRNFGHQAALLSALHTLEADCYITIDADLQDDETSMVDMISAFIAGHDIVYGIRKERSTDRWFKRVSALAFYKVMRIMGTSSVYNHADFRLMSQRAVHELRHYSESNVFLRGLVSQLGFPTTEIYYNRKARQYGESKYSRTKMFRLAWNGITSFSNAPLKFATFLGLGTCLFSMILLLFCLWDWMNGHTVAGWTSIIITISFFSGTQMLLLGIIGEYIGKVFIESKRRPLFIIKDHLSTK